MAPARNRLSGAVIAGFGLPAPAARLRGES
jgi:hypothetical protein